jgi:hypothetical protein
MRSTEQPPALARADASGLSGVGLSAEVVLINFQTAAFIE